MKDVEQTPKTKESKVLVSPCFGEIEVLPEHIYYFEGGLIGFEDLTSYILIADEKIMPFQWLQSVDEPSLSFPVINPWLILQDYAPGKRYIKDNLIVLSIVTLKDKDDNITANLKAPVILDTDDNSGKQEILTSDKYQTDYQITKRD